MAPFQVQFVQSRRQRIVSDLFPWVPAFAGSLGYCIGLAVLAVDVSPWFLGLLCIPVLLYHKLVALLVDLMVHSGQLVEIRVDDCTIQVLKSHKKQSLPLSGVIQVFRSGDAWTILHLNGTVLNIPTDSVTEEQINYLKGFARAAAATRRAAEMEN